MRCERLRLVNFCQHENLQLELTSGVLALVGRNGSGKSNVLGGIRFALLGENPNAGTKAENIRVTSGPRDPSYVELTFVHQEVRATVRRNLRPARPTATLTIDGDANVVEGDTAVTARILQILGTSADVVTDLVLVAQRDVFGFIDKTPAKRAEQFQKLFQVEMVADLVKVLGEHLKTVEVPEVVTGLDELRQRLQQWQQQVQLLETECVRYPDHTQIQEQYQLNYNLVAAYQRQQKSAADRQAWQQELTTLSGEIATQKDALTQLLSQVADARKEQEQQQVQSAISRAAQQQWEQYRQQARARESLEESIRGLTLRLQEMTAPTYAGETATDTATLSAQLSQLRLEEGRLSRFVSSFQSGVVECPTCHTAVTSLTESLEEARQRLPTLRQQAAAVEGELQSLQRYQQELQAFQTQQSHLQQQLSQGQAHLDSFPELTPPDLDEQQIREQLQSLQMQQQEVARLERQLQQTNTQLSQAEGRRAVLSQRLEEAAQPGEDTVVTEAQMQAAQAASSQWLAAAEHRRQLEQQIAAARTQVTHLQERIADAERTQQVAERRRSWHQLCQQLRVQLPAAAKRVAQIRLQQLEARVNECLGLLGADFRVVAGEDLSFIAQFPDGRQQRAERLSGGQQVVLALVVRIELNLLLAGGIGMLYLDEPTAYLDEDHIQGLEPLLTQLKVYAASHGLQVLMITHERALGPLFDRVMAL